MKSLYNKSHLISYKFCYALLITILVLINNANAQTGYTTTAPSGGAVAFAGAAFGSGTSTVTITRPTSGCYAYGIDLSQNNGFTFAASFAGTHAAANKFQYSSGLGSNVLTLNTSGGAQTMAACTPRAAISITPILTLSAPSGVLWYNVGNYYYISTKSAASILINVTLKSPTAAGTDVNTLANNLCTTSWHSNSNLNWGWLTLAAPTSGPSSGTPYCTGNTIALVANPATTNSVSNPAMSYTYAWTGPNSFTSTTANPSITSATTSNSGTYNLTVTDNYSCPQSSASTTSVTVKAALDPSSRAYTLAQCAKGATPAAYADITANAIAGGTSGAWAVTGGGGTVTNTSTNNTQITGLSGTLANTLTWTLQYTAVPACAVTSSTLTIPATSLSLNTITQNKNDGNFYFCRTCTIKDGEKLTYYDPTTKNISTEITDATNSLDMGSTYVNTGYDYDPATTPTASDVNTKTTNQGDQQPYLPRHWTIKPGGDQSAKVRVYFSTAELTALQTKANGTRYQFSGLTDVAVSKFPMDGCGTNYTDVTPTGSGAFVPSIITSGLGGYYAEFDVTSFSTFFIHPQFYPFAALPVELVSFAGTNYRTYNQLTWVTATEENTARFEIEKSIDGANWTYVGEVAAAGNSTAELTYQYSDNFPTEGNNYYRLKIVDYSTYSTHSNVINVFAKRAEVNDIIRVYPNPTSVSLHIDIQSVTDVASEIKVIDIMGRVCMHTSISLHKGINVVTLDITDLASGSYLLNYKDNTGKIRVKKFERL